MRPHNQQAHGGSWRFLACALGFILFLVLMAMRMPLPAGPEEKPGQILAEVEQTYLIDGKRVTYVYSQKYMGISTTRELDPKEVAQLTANIASKARPVPHVGNVWLVPLDKPLDLDKIREQTAQLQKANKELIEEAGPVFRFPGRKHFNLLTGKVSVTLKPGLRPEDVPLIKELGLVVDRPNRFRRSEYRLKFANPGKQDAARVAEQLGKDKQVESALAQFIELQYVPIPEPAPAKPCACAAWHHDNRGENGLSADADMDTVEAWRISEGNPDLVIAVIDTGFDMDHPELKPNLWRNPDEILNGKDDDGNGLVDDLHGYDFKDNDPDPFGSSHDHGTRSAGCVGACGNNLFGIRGTASRCRLMLLRARNDNLQVDDAIDYAWAKGASVITISYAQMESDQLNTAIKNAVKKGRCGRGCVILYSIRQTDDDDTCSRAYPDIIVNPRVLAVSDSTGRDEKFRSRDTVRTSFGNCMDVLAPSHGSNGHNIATTVPTTFPLMGCPRGYTLAASGTSSATPLTAGVAALVLSVRPELSWREVHRVLQDTCDKIEDDRGCYHPRRGFSRPLVDKIATHGYGRINAFEAVRLVAPRIKQGRGGTDLYLRDNRLDWGNTERPSHVLFGPNPGTLASTDSRDIKVDPRAVPEIPTTSVAFDELPDEQPRAGVKHKVYVRVRNRGPVEAVNVKVKLYVTPTTDPLPALASWTVVDGEMSLAAVPYCGCSLAGRKGKDRACIVTFEWQVPAPMLGEPTAYSLLAVATCDQDPVTDHIEKVSERVACDNNVTMKNVEIK